MSSVTAPPRRRAKHPVDEVLAPQKLAIYGLQHVMAFYAGAVVVPILLAGAIGLSQDQLIHLINADLFTCGIASLLQTVGFWKVGVKLPLLQGVTFTAVSPMIVIGLDNGKGTAGLVYIYGAVIVAGIFMLLIAPFFSELVRLFPRWSPAPSSRSSAWLWCRWLRWTQAAATSPSPTRTRCRRT